MTPDGDDIEDRIAALLAGELDEPARARLEAEIDRHPRWLAVLAVLATSPPAPVSASKTGGSTARRVTAAHRRRVHPGTTIGRYEVLSEIGRGGMGVVLEARDPVLRRVLALKVLHAADPARAVREARALALVKHPAVIEVFDVGRFRDGVYIAMERLHGSTLAAWLRDGPRDPARVLDVLLAAGEGLAAAHEAGLVHRDFKPSNVIVAPGRRVIVLDFGLARTLHSEPTLEHARPRDDTAVVGDRTHAAGTPAYMAPEQRAGRPCDARADQYAFAVTLYEALHGHRPGEPSSARRGPTVVARAIDRVLARALAPLPEQRYASMRDVLRAIERARGPRRRWRAWAAALALGATLGVLAATDDDACGVEREELERSWTRQVRADVASRFAAAPPDTVEHALARVDEFVSAWTTAHASACPDAPAGDRAGALACLYAARASARAVIEVLVEGPTDARALTAVRALPSPSRCRESWSGAPPPVAHDPAWTVELEHALAESDAHRLAGDHDSAQSRADEAVAIAARADDPIADARAHLARGLSRRDAGPYPDAEADLRTAADRAAEGDGDRIAADAYAELAWVVGYAQARHEEGRELVRHADAWSERVGRPPALEVQWRRAAGWIEQDAGDFAAAREHFAAALSVAERMEAADPLAAEEVAMCLNGLGAVATGEADFDLAESAFRRASDRLARARGEAHPQVAEVRNNLAAVLRARGRFAEASDLFDANLVAFTAAFGEDHPTVGQTLLNRAVVALDSGEMPRALDDAERALVVLERALGEDHPLVAKTHTLLGDARLQMHDPEGALRDLSIALDQLVKFVGPDHPSVANVHTSMGSALYELSRFDTSIEHHEEALRILEAAWGEEHPDLALVLSNLALAQRARGDDDEARARLERAVQIAGPTAIAMARTRLAELLLDQREPGDAARALELLEAATAHDDGSERDPVLRGATWLGLARALLATGGDGGRAARLADAATEAFSAAGEAELATEAAAVAQRARARP